MKLFCVNTDVGRNIDIMIISPHSKIKENEFMTIYVPHVSKLAFQRPAVYEPTKEVVARLTA